MPELYELQGGSGCAEDVGPNGDVSESFLHREAARQPHRPRAADGLRGARDRLAGRRTDGCLDPCGDRPAERCSPVGHHGYDREVRSGGIPAGGMNACEREVPGALAIKVLSDPVDRVDTCDEIRLTPIARVADD